MAGIGCALWIGGLEARLIQLQVIDHGRLVDRAGNQQRRTVTLYGKRGEILDRRGRVLAYSVDADTIYAVPARIADPDAIAAAVCGALDACGPARRTALAGLLDSRRAFAYVQRQASPDEARRVAALDLDGIGFLSEHRRYYPHRTLAAHLVGYVGIDNQGLSGIESTYDADIGGGAGEALIRTDARGQAFSRIERPPPPGAGVELTIDLHLQHIVERELQAGIRANEADAGTVVMLDPATGDVLALASAPTFNPNAFAAAAPAARRNRAIQDVYEPGSTFKVVTASAALEEQVVHLGEQFDVSAGAITIGGDRIEDFARSGVLSFTDVLVRSSNVGVIRIGLRLGPERISRYVRRFGFGQRLSDDFPSESTGLVSSPARLTDRGIASISMGYQVAVTPLQMAAAVAAVANGGELVVPRVVRAVIRDGVRTPTERRVIRRAVSPGTAAELVRIMTAVADRGTARRARVPGYAVAGKTGTAEKLIRGRYSETDHYASFVGFAPAEAPRFVALVMIDTPRRAVINGVRQRAYTGGLVAAPIFQRIAEAALLHLEVPPTRDAVPPAQVPVTAGGPPPPPRPQVGTGAGAADRMPDLRGLSARQAVEAAGRIGLRAAVVGDGTVTRQDPPPGAAIGPGAAAVFRLSRRAPPGDQDRAP